MGSDVERELARIDGKLTTVYVALEIGKLEMDASLRESKNYVPSSVDCRNSGISP